MADEIAVDWPNRYLDKIGPELTPRDAACVLTHDAKLDVPALVAALKTRVGYIGVMGNRRTHTNRMERLRDAGVDDAGLARMMAPIGLDIGARTPEETALSICAEIISLRTGHQAPSLRDRSGPIHPQSGTGEETTGPELTFPLIACDTTDGLDPIPEPASGPEEQTGNGGGVFEIGGLIPTDPGRQSSRN
jgi:hypothetical protein